MPTSPLRGEEACYWGAWPLENRGPSEDTRSHGLTADYSKVKKGVRGLSGGLSWGLRAGCSASPPRHPPPQRKGDGVEGRSARGIYNPALGALPAAGAAGSGARVQG